MLCNNLINDEDWSFFASLERKPYNKHQKNNYAERYFLMCQRCYWCSSYLPCLDYDNE